VGLVTTRAADLGGGELLLTGFAIWSANVMVFALAFWEVDAGGPARRLRGPSRVATDFQFPQDQDAQPDDKVWQPQVWDYVYVSLTNSIAFSPTDTLPLTAPAKILMAAGSTLSAVTILLVAARAVNILS
jgi:hypothetical protein